MLCVQKQFKYVCVQKGVPLTDYVLDKGRSFSAWLYHCVGAATMTQAITKTQAPNSIQLGCLYNVIHTLQSFQTSRRHTIRCVHMHLSRYSQFVNQIQTNLHCGMTALRVQRSGAKTSLFNVSSVFWQSGISKTKKKKHSLFYFLSFTFFSLYRQRLYSALFLIF